MSCPATASMSAREAREIFVADVDLDTPIDRTTLTVPRHSADLVQHQVAWRAFSAIGTSASNIRAPLRWARTMSSTSNWQRPALQMSRSGLTQSMRINLGPWISEPGYPNNI